VIPSKQGIPLSAEGATFAEATGEIRLAAQMSGDRRALLVTAEVPRAKIELPARRTQSLQGLDPDPTIVVGVREEDGTLTPRARRGRGGRAAGAPDAARGGARRGTGRRDASSETMTT